MSISRRTALSVLGMTSASALASEDFTPKRDTGFRFASNVKMTAAALRRLADDLENGGSLLCKVELNAKMVPDAFLVHDLVVSFALKDDIDGA